MLIRIVKYFATDFNWSLRTQLYLVDPLRSAVGLSTSTERMADFIVKNIDLDKFEEEIRAAEQFGREIEALGAETDAHEANEPKEK